MTVLQTVNLSADAVKMRWKEPYVTAGINQKNIASHPKGVLAGFNVVPSAGFVVNVQIDPTLSLSVANILETTGGYYSVTVVQPTNILIDLTSTPAATAYTCYIVVDAQYTVGATSAAQVKVVDALTDADWVVLAKVNVPAIGPITTAHINSGYRNSVGDSEGPEMHSHFNLINNPTFEATTNGWVNSGFLTLTATTYTSKAGSYSLRANLIVAGLASGTTGPIPVIPGRAYRVSAWMRSTTAGVPTPSDGPVSNTGNGAKLQVGFYDAAGAQIGSWVDVEAAFTGASTTWEERKTELTAPALSLTARVRIYFDNCNGTLYLDEVEFASHMHDEVMKSAVFGGDTVADEWHKHSAMGLTYAGSGPFADGSTLLGPTIEDGIDHVASNLGGLSGAAKIGYSPTTPKDLTTARVDLALDELDDKKAGIALANIFTKNNTITNAVTNTAALTATGNGTGEGVSGTGGATDGIGVRGTGGGGQGNGGYFETSVTAFSGVAAVSGIANSTNSIGVFGRGNGTGGGVHGRAQGTGAGVQGQVPFATIATGVPAGVLGFGSATAPGVLGRSGGVGTAVRGDGAAGGGAGIGVEGQGGAGRPGVKGTGGNTAVPSGTSVLDWEIGAGVSGTGGSDGAFGVIGFAGAGPTQYATPTQSVNFPPTNVGVMGVGASFPNTYGSGAGVYGYGAGGVGVYGYGGDYFGDGVAGRGSGNFDYGVRGFGQTAPGVLVAGSMMSGGDAIYGSASNATDGIQLLASNAPNWGEAGGIGITAFGGAGGKAERGNLGAQGIGGTGGYGIKVNAGHGALAQSGGASPLVAATAYPGGDGGHGGRGILSSGGLGRSGGAALNNGGAGANGGIGGSGGSGGRFAGGTGGSGGAGVGTGISGVGGNGGAGIEVYGGSAGTGSTAGAAGDGVLIHSGGLRIMQESGGTPFTKPIDNQLFDHTIPKAYAKVHFSGGVGSIAYGANIASFQATSLATGFWGVNLAKAVPIITRATVCQPTENTGFCKVDSGGTGTDSYINIIVYDAAGVAVNLTSGTHRFTLICFGAQTTSNSVLPLPL
jgi:hypothetical protein